MAKASILGLGAQRLGLLTSQAEMQCSLVPADYKYPQPSPAQFQRLVKQQMGAPQPAGAQPAAGARGAAGFGGAGALQGAAPTAAAPPAGAAKPCHLAASVDDLFNHHLALDLDDDCLRILLGEDEDESAPCASGGSGKGAAAGGSEKSSATADQGGAAGEAEAASHDDDDIAMLFGEMRHTGGSSMEAMELHLLGTAPLAATDDSDTTSQAGGDAAAAGGGDGEVLMAAAEAGAGLKRSKSCCAGGAAAAASPAGRGLMLSMNYEAAAQCINLELLAGGCGASPSPCSEGMEAMLPLLSPIMAFAAIDTPDSPLSLASGCDALSPDLALNRQDSTSKRKRAVRQ